MGHSGLACFSIRSSEQEIIVVILVVINISLVSTVSSHLENIELYGKCTEILNLGISNFELIMRLQIAKISYQLYSPRGMNNVKGYRQVKNVVVVGAHSVPLL